MIPVGYIYKKIATRPEWLQAGSVRDVYSVSGCMSAYFADYINFWKHNGYWFFDSPKIIEDLARERAIDLTGMKLFYYEVFENEYDEKEKKWQAFKPEESFTTNVKPPAKKQLEGFDVVTFWARTSPECSPLSCNNLAKEIAVNEHCLLADFDAAKTFIETGKFDNSEPGPHRIFAVYSVGD